MRHIEQVAFAVKDMEAAKEFWSQGEKRIWHDDRVVSDLLFFDAVPEMAGSAFTVDLSFNYDIMPGKEFELLKILQGYPYHRYVAMGAVDVGHVGYHIKDNDMGAFMDELNQWIRNGYRIAHVSVTRSHSNDRRVRYIYGIVDTIQQTGVLTKIIQRLELGSDHLSKEVGIRTFQYLGLD